MTFRHRWLSKRYRTPWGDVPCGCAPEVREHALLTQHWPRWLARIATAFLNDRG